MKISLILCTIGRKNVLKRFLESLIIQTYKNFEIILVDQNEYGFLDSIISQYQEKLDIVHLRSGPGLSKARNKGLAYAEGDLIGFPDDDCEYEAYTLFKIYNIFLKMPSIEVLIGDHVGEFSSNPKESLKQVSNRYNLFLCKGISFVIFFRKTQNNKALIFDEDMGVGSGTIYGSGEETDMLLKLLYRGCKIYKTRSLQIRHDLFSYPLNIDEASRKANRYGLGRWYLLKKHNFPLIFKIINILYPLLILLKKMDIRGYKIYTYSMMGRCGIACK